MGGQVGARHDDLKWEWNSLCSKALTPAAVSDEPLLKTSQDVRGATSPTAEEHTAPLVPHKAEVTTAPAAQPRRTRTRGAKEGNVEELRGDIGVHGFWQKGSATIFDVRVTNTN